MTNWIRLFFGIYSIAVSVDLAGLSPGLGWLDVITLTLAGIGALLIYQYDQGVQAKSEPQEEEAV